MKCKDCNCGEGVTLDTTYGHSLFYELIEKMAKLHANKNRDYGNGNPLGNFMTAEDLGIDPFLGVLVRMSDKWTRICSLTKQGQQHVKDESIEDTLLDLANYCLLALVIKDAVKYTHGGAFLEEDASVQISKVSEGQVAGQFVQPTPVEPVGVIDTDTERSSIIEDINNEYIQTLKSFTCLTCVAFAGDPDLKAHNCYHCIFNGRTREGSLDYYVDTRLVAAMSKQLDTDSIHCVAPNSFCACGDCRARGK